MTTVRSGVRPRAVVLDIEGTVGSIDHVHEVLFPYARRRLAPWFEAHQGSEAHDRILAAVRDHQGAPGLDERQAVELLTGWADADTKAAPLKALQALIWTEGFADGTLRGHLYPEVPEVLRGWHRQGIALYIYSSGAASAQRDWFRHSGHGDLTPLLQGYFDLENTGGKREPDSYRTALRTIGVPAADVLFLSDVGEELDAAAAAGWRVTGVRRAGDRRGPHLPGHPTVAALDELRFDPFDPFDPSTPTPP